MNPVEQAALEYARRGWAVIPLCPKSKLPHADLLPRNRAGEPSWKLLTDPPATETEIRDWFRRAPDINIGIALGEASGNLVVVDVDRAPARPLHLPPTVQAQTGRGTHYYYIADGPLPTRKCSWGEIRANGAYVVAPPSLHPRGTQYAWSDYCSPVELELAPLPSDIMEAVERDRQQAAAERPRVSKDKYICSRLPSPVSDIPRMPALSADLDLVEWASREDVAVAVMRLCGVEVSKLGKAFRCPLPGHEEHKASAALWRQEDGTIGFHDFHQKSGRDWFSLAEVYASVKARKVVKLGPGEKAAWLLRGLVEAGLLKAPSVLAPKLPADARPVVRDVYEGFRRLLAIRSLYNAGQDAAPFSWRFAAAWCGRSDRHCGEAMGWLLAHGYLRQVQAAQGTRKVALFALGASMEGGGQRCHT